VVFGSVYNQTKGFVSTWLVQSWVTFRSNGYGLVWLAMFLLKIFRFKDGCGKHPLRPILIVLVFLKKIGFCQMIKKYFGII
jgi:hypothetical protein